MKTFTIDLHCDITGEKLGEVVLDTKYGWDPNMTEAEYKERAGIVDMRSPSAEVACGTYKELEDEYKKAVFGKKNVESPESFIKKHRTRAECRKHLPKQSGMDNI